MLRADAEVIRSDDLAYVLKGNALDLPLEDESVDLIVTSPPYFALRSYQDGGEHYDGQIGSEPTPQDFLEALWAATREMVRVLKPTGSIFVNLGDKYAGSGGHNNSGLAPPRTGEFATRKHNVEAPRLRASRRSAPDRYNQETGGVRPKSLMGLPWRYAIGCIDDIGLILRAEIIWSKPNGLPESVTDRVRRSHEQWFHFTKEGRYFAAVDEIREPHALGTAARYAAGYHPENEAYAAGGPTKNGPARHDDGGPGQPNPLGKLPGSVWTIPTEPLKVPDELGIDHFAAFPSEWPRRLTLGWSPSGICIECGEPRRPVVDKVYLTAGDKFKGGTATEGRHKSGVRMGDGVEATITGYACACPEPTADTTPAVVLDPFGGTGTVAMVARALGRVGISVDLSSDYCRLASWRVFDSNHDLKIIDRTEGKAVAKTEADRREKETAGLSPLF